MKKAITIFAVSIMSLTAFAPLASAQEQNLILDSSSIEANEVSGLSEQLIDGLDQFVEFDGEKYTLNVPIAVKLAYSDEDIATVQAQIDESNQMLKETESDSHTYVDEDAKTVNFLISDTEVLRDAGQKVLLRAAGVTKFERYWWGMKIYMSKTFLNYSGGSLVAMAGYITNKLPWKHPYGLLVAGAMGALGVFGTSAKHGYVVRIAGFGALATVTGVWRQ